MMPQIQGETSSLRWTFSRRGMWALLLLGLFAIPPSAFRISAAADSVPILDLEGLRDPVQALARSSAPLILAERLLEAGEDDGVERFRQSLSLPQRRDLEAGIRSLQALYRGDYGEALDALSDLPSADPWFARQKSYLEGLLAAGRGFIAAPDDHFLLWTSSDEDFLARYAHPALENAREKMEEVFRVTPGTAVLVEVYPTSQAFSQASTLSDDTLERSGAIGICKFRRLMVLSPRATPLGYRWLDAAAHEYNHLLVNRLSGTLCPLWLHEGVSRYYETAWRRAGPFEHTPAAETALAQAALAESSAPGKGLIPFQRMEPSMVYLENQDQVALAFAEVSDAVAYIVEQFGPGKLAELLRAFRRFPRDRAFVEALGLSEAELEESWRESLKDRTWRVSKGALAQKIELGPMDEVEFVGADLQGHVRLGDRLRQQDQAAAALIQYKKALEQEPDNGVVLLKAARAYLAMGDPENAEALLRRAVEKNPSYVTPYVALGELLFEDARYDQAQRYLQEALEINPFNPRVHELLGRIALDVGNFSLARQSLELALRLDPDDEGLRALLRQMPKNRP